MSSSGYKWVLLRKSDQHGKFGLVYKAAMTMKMPTSSRAIRHRNLVKILTSCSSFDHCASAIEYLHHEGPCQLFTNVLLDNEMTRMWVISRSSTSTGESNDLLLCSSRLGDVYSYGVLLLEMFTGMSPVDDKFKDGLSLRGYVRAAAASPEQLTDIIDRNLHSADNDITYREECVRDCVVSVFDCGLSCSNESPHERCDMTEVSKVLSAARERLLS
ncbi:putative LRR receptor-like serine/threonine-protein kinase [Ananas comosus]|uniref:Putative LRR receptor-like serine/threonine-protein kinase n=1 Tax=Ananas comosus TaxID=4615 RepID=A0A199V3C2_ANACO|nr:putative LRR receptor-like serine/threonine-protein kinase [Ananas comosus]